MCSDVVMFPDAAVSTAVYPHRHQTRLIFGGRSNETRRMATRQHLHHDKRPDWSFGGFFWNVKQFVTPVLVYSCETPPLYAVLFVFFSKAPPPVDPPYITRVTCCRVTQLPLSQLYCKRVAGVVI